ncbi:MAG: hypothetical protein HQ551_09855 [Desulfobacteraceae bacterium]|nr:hypothetical protein [Desulfobacteraceae bacterium]
MKSLQAFWKLFRRKTKTTEAQHQNKADFGKRDRADSVSRSRDLKESKPSIFRKKREKAHIQVGLDFGTSATKVVFSQHGKRPFKVLNFGHNLPNWPPYCIPSVGCIGENSRLLLGVTAARSLLKKEWDAGLQRLKVVVAGKHDSRFNDPLTETKYYDHFKAHKQTPVDPEMLTAVFLAYVIQNTRKIIKNLPEYSSSDLNFAFNICMPIDHVENSNLKPVFERIFAWAELIEDEWDKSEMGFDPLKAAHSLKNRSANKESKVFAVPESVASFASYLISLRKKKGLHAIIDLGAGTTDLSICNLFIDTGDIKSYWYAARNLPRGTIGIERALAHCMVKLSGQRKYTSNDICECLDGLSSTTNKNDQSEKGKKLNSVVFKELCDLRDSREYKGTWGSAYSHFKQDYLWKDVEIFTCGGGSNLSQIDKAFSEPWWTNLNTIYRVSKLPVPDNYQPGKSGAPFERMSVAYGLAIPFPQLDDFTLPDDSPDHTPEPPSLKYLDHEELYPKD